VGCALARASGFWFCRRGRAVETALAESLRLGSRKPAAGATFLTYGKLFSIIGCGSCTPRFRHYVDIHGSFATIKLMSHLTRTKIKTSVYPLISPKERILLLESIRGMWKNRKPDPIRELRKMRRERERKLPFLG